MQTQAEVTHSEQTEGHHGAIITVKSNYTDYLMYYLLCFVQTPQTQAEG